MRVLCCYTSLHPAASAALGRWAPGTEFAGVSGDPSGYWRQITARWDGTQDLAIVEQDIEIREDVLPGFGACPGLWCVYPYEIHERGLWLDFGLGCTRFRAQAQRAVTPAAIQEKPGCCETCHGEPGCWMHLDCKIAWAMAEAGIDRCVHSPGVEHWNQHVQRGQLSACLPARWHRLMPLNERT